MADTDWGTWRRSGVRCRLRCGPQHLCGGNVHRPRDVPRYQRLRQNGDGNGPDDIPGEVHTIRLTRVGTDRNWIQCDQWWLWRGRRAAYGICICDRHKPGRDNILVFERSGPFSVRVFILAYGPGEI